MGSPVYVLRGLPCARGFASHAATLGQSHTGPMASVAIEVLDRALWGVGATMALGDRLAEQACTTTGGTP